MTLRRLVVVLVTAAALTMLTAPPAHATIIEFEALDVIDLIAGEDLWEYRYFVSDFSFQIGQGFSVYFDTALYRHLQDPLPRVNSDWDVLPIQPDPVLPDGGWYDAAALVDGASLANAFVVGFTWLGGAAPPGSQRFTVNQFDAAGNLIGYLDQGQTIPRTVPEPSTLLLMSIGALGIAWHRRRGWLRH
jgi:hypothetical protein